MVGNPEMITGDTAIHAQAFHKASYEEPSYLFRNSILEASRCLWISL